jgi:hypothetical protein
LGCLISRPRQQRVQIADIRSISCAAVLTPMPGAPGTLSTLSPASACTSITFSGGDAELLHHPSASMRLSFIVSTHHDAVVTSCIRSLSEEMMETCAPAFAAWRGVGGDDVVGLIALQLDAGEVEGAGRVADQGNCGRRSSGGSGRWAL